jgi:hypothetical protein
MQDVPYTLYVLFVYMFFNAFTYNAFRLLVVFYLLCGRATLDIHLYDYFTKHRLLSSYYIWWPRQKRSMSPRILSDSILGTVRYIGKYPRYYLIYFDAPVLFTQTIYYNVSIERYSIKFELQQIWCIMTSIWLKIGDIKKYQIVQGVPDSSQSTVR